MKKVLLGTIVLTFVCAIAAWAVESPEFIDLREAWGDAILTKTQKTVVFKHAFHQEKNKDVGCTKCHATDQGGKFIPAGDIKGMNDSNGAHKFCWYTCHEAKNVHVKKTCTKCHTK